MPSIQQILNYVDRKYDNQETDANKVSDLNDIHKRIYTKIAMLKNEYETYETQTIADQLTYSLPSDCSLENIVAVKVPDSSTITSSTEWTTYKYAGLNDDTTYGYYYGDAGNNKIALVSYDRPINTADLSIRILYYKLPNALLSTNLSTIPELDEYYHDLLKYGLIVELANQGQNPDTEIADYWQAKYDEFMRDVEDNLSKKYQINPIQSTQVREWW